MKHYVTDTHPLIWALSGDSRLSPVAQAAFAEADAGKAIVIIPPIVPIEMIFNRTNQVLQYRIITGYILRET